MKETIGIVGLGRMGMPAAKVLLKAGFHVVGCEKRREAVREFVSLGGESALDCKSVAKKAETIIVFVLNDAQVVDVVTGAKGLLEESSTNHVIICMATINRELVEQISNLCASKKVGFVDCPCTGGPARAAIGNLTLIVAAPHGLLERCRPILAILGNIVHVGETPGMGQAVKHCNQLLVSTTHAAVMEVILMAQKSGVDVRQTCKVIGTGAAGSEYFRLLSSSVLDKTPSPCSLGLMCKDSHLVVHSSRQLELQLLVANAANQYFLAAEPLGLEEEESAELMQVLERFSKTEG